MSPIVIDSDGDSDPNQVPPPIVPPATVLPIIPVLPLPTGPPPTAHSSLIPSPPSSPILVDSDGDSDYLDEKISLLQEAFPTFSKSQVEVVLRLTCCDPELASPILLKCNLKSLLRLLAFNMKRRKRGIEIDPENIVQSFIAIVHKSRAGFDVSVPLEVHLTGSEAVDVGGVRRHFLCDLLHQFATSRRLALFEGDIRTGTILPTVNYEAIVSGYFKLFGKVLVHSLLQEGPSFPYLPKSVYVYMCTSKLEEALPFVSIDDLPFLPQQVVKQVSLCL